MTAQAAQLGAAGVVGVRVNHGIQQRFEAAWAAGATGREMGGLMVTFHAVGTAIREHERPTLYAAADRQSTC